MLEILLLGVAHEFQWENVAFLNRLTAGQLENYQEQRHCYELWVRQCVRGFQPKLIFDEMNLPEGDSTDRLTDTGVPWVYMDIPEEVRRKYGLTAIRNTMDELWIERVDSVRENHWLVVIESITTACKIDRALVVCGAAHLPSLSEKLRIAGHRVSSKSVFKESWCDLDWHPDELIREFALATRRQ